MKKIFNTEINENNINEIVELSGWVSRIRNLGGLIFIDLRDRSGIIQLVVNPESKYYELANTLKNEYVINVTGKVVYHNKLLGQIATWVGSNWIFLIFVVIVIFIFINVLKTVLKKDD